MVSRSRWRSRFCVASAARQQQTAGSIVDRVNSWTVPACCGSKRARSNLNPLIGQLSFYTDLSMLWSGHLFDWSDEGKMIPDLATELPGSSNGGISADGRTIVYHLRHGVLWQDGQPFGADDVIFTWRAIMNPRNHIPVREGYDLIAGIDAPDVHTLVVHLKRPYAPFLTTFFSMSSTAYAVLPKHLQYR
jgi:peptide/nickel transport system substrate-binding protein